MQYSEFEHQVERMRNVYSASSLNAERVKVWWDRFKSVSVSRFERALGHVVGESTTQALPPVSKIAEALMLFPDRADATSNMQEMQSPHRCAACRDFGYGFVGDVLVRCTCETGRYLNPADFARQQAHYVRGKAFLARGRNRAAFLAKLPYDPNDRSES